MGTGELEGYRVSGVVEVILLGIQTGVVQV